MSNIPTYLSQVCLTLFRLAMSVTDPWPLSKILPNTKPYHQNTPSNPSISAVSQIQLKLIMARKRGILLKHRFRTLFRRLFRRKSSQGAYRRLDDHRAKPLSRLVSWTSRLKTKAKSMLGKRIGSGRGFIRLEQDPFLQKPRPIPKGHIAVYVGQEDGEFQRMFVPVVYFNHPLFGDLLKESEREYGFNHSGGITIPCRISEFERVQTRIKSVQSTRKLFSPR